MSKLIHVVSYSYKFRGNICRYATAFSDYEKALAFAKESAEIWGLKVIEAPGSVHPCKTGELVITFMRLDYPHT